MALFRTLIMDFVLANPAYIGATVSFYTVDNLGVVTTTLATLYADTTGSTAAANPQILDAEGKFAAPVYHDVQIIASISGVSIGDHDTGIIRPHFIGSRNLLINGDMRVAQRGTAFTAASTPANNDDTYLLDRWLLLSDGNDAVDVNQNTNLLLAIRLGDYAFLEADVETVQKKFGFLQIIEHRNLVDILGESAVVTLSFLAQVSGSTRLDNIKAVVLSWSGTADAPTSDVVSAWNAEDVTPTFAANWTAENVPANLGVTTSGKTFTIENIAVDTSNVTNLAVFIWSDAVADNDTLGTTLRITDVQLEVGPYKTTFERRPFGDELALCQRYFQRLNVQTDRIPGQATGATTATMLWPFEVEMRAAPTFALDTNGTLINAVSGTEAVTGLSSSNIGTKFMQFNVTVASGLNAGDATAYIPGDVTADAEL